MYRLYMIAMFLVSVLHCRDLKIAQLHLVMLNSMIHVPVQLNLLCGLQIFVPS